MTAISVAEGILIAIGIVFVVLLICSLLFRELFLYQVSGFTSLHRLWFWIRRDHS